MRTNQVQIKSLDMSDEDGMIMLLMNERIKETYMIPDFQIREDAARLFKRFQEASQSMDQDKCGIYLKDHLIGLMNDVDKQECRIELGYFIDPQYQCCGYATEALKAAIGDLFQKGYTEIHAGAFAHNIASRRVMEKCEMEQMQQEEVTYRRMNYPCVYYTIEKG